MIKGIWLEFSAENLKNTPTTLGVYAIANADKKVIYIGEGHIKARLQAHRRKSEFEQAAYYKYEKLSSKLRCQQRERALHKEFLKKHKGFLPLNNVHLGKV
jgi:predicted GIY-YIG superfamily endonuclease